MKKQQSGFTLIELMIVVAIIGILAAIAIPSYMDYTKRSHVSEGLTLAGAAKASVADYRATKGTWPSANASVSLPAAASISGNAVTSVAIGASGLITITYNDKVTNNATVFLRPIDNAGSISWRCTGGTVSAAFRPSNCR